MGIQPSLFMVDTARCREFIQRERGESLRQCPQLTQDGLRSDEICWAHFSGRPRDCCGWCSARPDAPLRLSRHPEAAHILTQEHTLPKHIYLWAKLHRDDTFSWTGAYELPDDFWLPWARLTERTTHLTADADGRGLCGLLSTHEPPQFIEGLGSIGPPEPEGADLGLDLFGSDEEYQSLMQIRAVAQACYAHECELARVHDFVC